MGRLPVYVNNANVQKANIVKARNNPVGQALDNAGKQMQQLAIQWQKTQNAAEALDGKNKIFAEVNDILTEAEDFHDYKSPKDLQTKENELLDRMSKVVPNVSNGFTNDVNRTNFAQEQQLTTLQNMEKLKAIFRQKYIDNNAANLVISHENNMKAFIRTGNPAYKQSYLADLENSFKAGYISEKEKNAAAIKVNGWDFSFASSQMLGDPEGTLKNISKFNLQPDEKQKLMKAAFTQIENKKLFDGMDKLISEGTEGNRLYNKYIDEGLSLDEIQNNQSISDNEKMALLKLSGYDTATFKQNQKNAENITFQLELDDEIKGTISESVKGRPKLAKGRDIDDLLKLRDKVYDGVINHGLSKEKATKYMNSVIGASLREAKNIVDRKDSSAIISNPYAEGLVQVDNQIAAAGIENDRVRAGVHNLYFEAMDNQMTSQNPDGVIWSDLPEKTRKNIQDKAVAYALSNMPNVAEAKAMFSQYLPASERKEALDNFINQYNAEMNETQRKELAKQVVETQSMKAKAKTEMTMENATYEFSDDDKAFMQERSYTPEEVIYTAQLRGVSVTEVLSKLRGNQ
ncbi:MAG: hypothetical protein J6M62_10405 [Selenomonadaceae bacterium]|nr:hypothetical protein [Selenomonadaceae bacterium]